MSAKSMGISMANSSQIRPIIAVLVASLISLMPAACSAPSDETQYDELAVEILQEAVNLRTVAGRQEIKVLADLLATRFLDAGFNADDVHVIETEPGVAALVVRYRGSASNKKKPVMIMAHLDVVDAFKEDWSVDPFVMIEKDGYFYGRGVIDNKGSIAATATTLMRLKAEDYVPARDLILVYTGDEETTANSIRTLLTEHRELIDAEFALNSDSGKAWMDETGKPISFDLQAAEKAYMTFQFTSRNKGGHSSRPRLDNAIYELADAIKNIEALRFPVRSNEITRNYFSAVSVRYDGALGQALKNFAEDPSDQTAEYLIEHPKFVGQTRTTCVATMLSGGHAENALPQSATLTVQCRAFPGVTTDEVKSKLLEAINNPDIEITVLSDPKPSPASPLNPAVVKAYETAVQARFKNTPVIPIMSVATTDGWETRAAGIPTYGVEGLLRGPDDDRAHGRDERLAVDAFLGALDHWYVLLKEISQD